MNSEQHRRATSRRREWGAACGALFLLLLAAPLCATTFLAKDLSTLCSEAEVAFLGTVTEVRSRWSDAGHGSLETLVTFSDLTGLFGAVGNELTLRFPGGEIDGIREQVAGVPRFSEGERVVLLVRRERSASPIVGFNQGLFRVIDGPEGSVVPRPGDLALVEGTGGSVASTAVKTGGRETIPLDTFLSLLRLEFERR